MSKKSEEQKRRAKTVFNITADAIDLAKLDHETEGELLYNLVHAFVDGLIEEQDEKLALAYVGTFQLHLTSMFNAVFDAAKAREEHGGEE